MPCHILQAAQVQPIWQSEKNKDGWYHQHIDAQAKLRASRRNLFDTSITMTDLPSLSLDDCPIYAFHMLHCVESDSVFRKWPSKVRNAFSISEQSEGDMSRFGVAEGRNGMGRASGNRSKKNAAFFVYGGF